MEILWEVLTFVDPISMRSLSLTSTALRDVCHSLVMSRGCVSPVWVRQKSRGQRRARVDWLSDRYRWFYSTAMTPILSWQQVNESEIQKHLKLCTFNQKSTQPDLTESDNFKLELRKTLQKKRTSRWFIL